MVHAWAAENLRGHEAPPARTQTELRRSGEDLVELLRRGADELAEALTTGDDDLDAMVFLLDAPAPRAFWARRQAHETTIHAIDALSAALGRPPTTAEAAVPSALAMDGIDELVRGFIPRGASRWRVDEAFTLAVCPTDSENGWVLSIGPETVESRSDATDAVADCRLSGEAAALYLGLWNRGDDLRESGRPGTLAEWRAVQRVRWS